MSAIVRQQRQSVSLRCGSDHNVKIPYDCAGGPQPASLNGEYTTYLIIHIYYFYALKEISQLALIIFGPFGIEHTLI